MTDARILIGHGTRIFIGLDESQTLDAGLFDQMLRERGFRSEWIEFGQPEPVLYEPGDRVESKGEIFEAMPIVDRIADKAAEAAVRDMAGKLFDDPRPAYRRIEFGGRHGGKMARMGRR